MCLSNRALQKAFLSSFDEVIFSCVSQGSKYILQYGITKIFCSQFKKFMKGKKEKSLYQSVAKIRALLQARLACSTL